MAMIHLEPQTLEMFSRALDGLKPPPNLSLSQWADKYRKLSAEASASQGQWNSSRMRLAAFVVGVETMTVL